MAPRSPTVRRPAATAARRLWLGLLLAVWLCGLRPGTARAHAWLLRSQPAAGAILPAAPTSIRLWFSESINLPTRAIEVTAPDGKRVDAGRAQIAAEDGGELVAALRAAKAGTYVVRWKVISADTHPVWDSFTFSVGAPSAVARTAEVAPGYGRLVLALQGAGRWLLLLGGALIVGGCWLWWRLLDPATAGLERRSRRRAWRAVLRLAALGSGLIALSAPVGAVAQMASLSDSWAQALTLDSFLQVVNSRLGLLLGLRPLLALGLYAVNAVLAYAGPPAGNAGRRPSPLLATQLALGTAALLSISLSGHAVSTDPVLVSLLLDWVHLLAMALWVGGLLALAATLPALLRDLGDEAEPAAARWALLAAVVPGFSRLALLATAALAATGTYSALQHMAGWDQLASTDYGRALALKLGLVAVVLAIAGVNLLVLGPAIRRVASGQTPRAADLWRLFRPLLRLEAAVLIAVLAAAAMLTSFAPARQGGTPPGAASGAGISVAGVAGTTPYAVLAEHAGPVLVTLAVAPSTLGPSQLAVSLTGLDEKGLGGSVRLRLSPPAGSGLATISMPLAAQTLAGQFGGSVALYARGVWRIELAVAPAGTPAARLRFSLTLPLRSARELLRRADHATNALRSMVTEQVVTAGTAAPRRLRYEDQAPDREHARSYGDLEQIHIGRHDYVRLPGKPWQRGTLEPGQSFRWPDAQYARVAPDATIVGQERIGGVSCAVVGFWLPYPNASYRLWIDRASGRILRARLTWPGHFEDDRYHSFDAGPRVEAP